MIALVYSSFQTLGKKHNEVVLNLILNLEITSVPRVCVNLRFSFSKNVGWFWVFLLDRKFIVLDMTHLFSVRISPSTVLSLLNNSSLIFLS